LITKRTKYVEKARIATINAKPERFQEFSAGFAGFAFERRVFHLCGFCGLCVDRRFRGFVFPAAVRSGRTLT